MLALLHRTSATASTDRPSSCHNRCVSSFDVGSRCRAADDPGAVLYSAEIERVQFSSRLRGAPEIGIPFLGIFRIPFLGRLCYLVTTGIDCVWRTVRTYEGTWLGDRDDF